MRRPTSIDDLPIEMIAELFGHLNLKDLTACSLVNKRWYSAFTACRLQKLFTSEEFCRFHLNEWSHSSRRVKESELCPLAMFNRWAEKPLLMSLKYLALAGDSFDLNKLNRFTQLVYLEIKLDDLGEDKVNLKLLKLKFLAIYSFNQFCHLTIDCPELVELVYNGEYYGDYYREAEDENLLNLKNPETIRKLHTNLFGVKLAPFINVECLVTYEFMNISMAILLSLPKLKELHYKGDIGSIIWRYPNEEEAPAKIDRMKRTLREFLEDIKKFKGTDFRFLFAAFPLNRATLDALEIPVEMVFFRRETVYNENLYIANYQLIDPDDTLEFIEELDYTRLMRTNAAEQVPMCFFNKFTGVERVVADGPVQNARHLLGFLKSLSRLTTLSLNSPLLGQEFYDQLPASARSLNDLVLRENKVQLNFDFIGEFPQLLRLPLNHSIDQSSVHLLSSILKHFDRLESAFFYVRSNSKIFFIQKICDSKMCEVSNYLQTVVLETENPQEILDFFRLRAEEESY